jgi:hypothetical protein
MAAPIIHEHDVQRVLLAMGKFVDKDLKIGCIQLWELQEKAFPGRGFDSPIHVEVLETVLHGSDRFNAAQRNASTLDRQQAKPPFIRAKDSPRTLKRW